MSNIKPQGRCIFCKGKGLSKQHVWPDWLKKVLPRNGNSHRQALELTSIRDGFVFIQPSFKEKKGHVGVRKIRNVCRTCNNGWMSRLESKVKAPLTSMMLGNETLLNPGTQKNISLWIAMTSIMKEYTDIKTIGIPAIHKEILKQHQTLPEGWQIWIGRYKGKRGLYGYSHMGANIVSDSEYEQEKSKGLFLPCNSQSTTFSLGEFFVHAVSLPVDEKLKYNLDNNLGSKLIKLWPLGEEDIIWFPADYVSDEEYFALSRHITKICPSPLKPS